MRFACSSAFDVSTLKLKFLRAQIKAGTDALERGEFAEVEDTNLDAYFEGLVAPALTRTR